MNTNVIDANIWIKIFLQLHPKYNKILRQVCHKFHDITNRTIFLVPQKLKHLGVENLPIHVEPMLESEFETSYQELLDKRKRDTCSLPNDPLNVPTNAILNTVNTVNPYNRHLSTVNTG